MRSLLAFVSFGAAILLSLLMVTLRWFLDENLFAESRHTIFAWCSAGVLLLGSIALFVLGCAVVESEPEFEDGSRFEREREDDRLLFGCVVFPGLGIAAAVVLIAKLTLEFFGISIW